MEKRLTRKTRLSAKLLAPAAFEITVKETSDRSEKVFEVIRSGGGFEITRGVYKLQQCTHEGYLALFAQFAATFGLRLPMVRKENRPKATGNVSLRVLLSENLASGMRYGYGNPSIVRVQGQDGEHPVYFLTVTSYDAPDSFPILYSRDLFNWTFESYIFPRGTQPAWAATDELYSDYRAPAMQFINGEFRVYFAARDVFTHELCIGMARARLPGGPYRADPEPILKHNVSDPHVLVYDEQTVYLFWKEDHKGTWPGLLVRLLFAHPEFISILFSTPEAQNTASFTITLWPWIQTLEAAEQLMALQQFTEGVNASFYAFRTGLSTLSQAQPEALREEIETILKYMNTPVYARQLSPDGSSLTREKIEVIENDQPWEGHMVEGISVTRYGEEYYLFYSGNDITSDQYGVGVAIAKAPLGPYVKVKEPLLRATTDWAAPGDPAVVAGPDGSMHMILHAYYPEQARIKQFRALLSLRVHLSETSVRIG